MHRDKIANGDRDKTNQTSGHLASSRFGLLGLIPPQGKNMINIQTLH